MIVYIYLSIYLSIYLIYLSIYLSIYVYIYIYLCVCICILIILYTLYSMYIFLTRLSHSVHIFSTVPCRSALGPTLAQHNPPWGHPLTKLTSHQSECIRYMIYMTYIQYSIYIYVQYMIYIWCMPYLASPAIWSIGLISLRVTCCPPKKGWMFSKSGYINLVKHRPKSMHGHVALKNDPIHPKLTILS